MDESSQLRILQRFHFYRRILESFDSNHFRSPSHWRQNLPCILRVISTILLLFVVVCTLSLIIWHVFDDDANRDTFLVAIQLVFMFLRSLLGIVSMICLKDIIIGTMNRLQRIIEKSEKKTLPFRSFRKNSLIEEPSGPPMWKRSRKNKLPKHFSW